MRQPQDLRRRNRREIVSHLLKGAPLTRPQLAERTGLSKVTVNAIVQELVSGGVLELAGTHGGASGRHPQVVQLHRQAGRVAALDVQPARAQVRVLALGGEVLHEDTFEYAPRDVTRALTRKLAQLPWQERGPLRHVVLGLPAPVGPSGEVGEPSALPHLDLSAVCEPLRRTRAPWTLENDANLVALATLQECPEHRSLAAMVERPSGTGLGLILGGELYRGVRGRAGELGRSRWPGAGRAEYLEQLPGPERMRAGATLLASLVQTLDLQHLVLGLVEERAKALRDALEPLLGEGVTLSLRPDVDALALTGAGRLALEAGRQAVLAALDSPGGGINDVA